MKKKIIVFLVVLSVLLQPHIPVQAKIEEYKMPLFKPGIWQTLDNLEGTSNNPEDWIESGNYCYEFLDSQKKYITIRDFLGTISDGILTIPEEIDGHKVLGVGTWVFNVSTLLGDEKHVWSVWGERTVMQDKPAIKELVLPEGLEFLGRDSFRNCYNMKKIYLPDSLVAIADGALGSATDLEEIEFPQGVYVDTYAFGYDYGGFLTCHPLKMVLYSNCHIDFNSDSYIAFPKGKKTELDIRYHENKSYYYALQGYITKLRVDKKLPEFQLEMGLLVWDTDNPPLLDYYVTKLIMNGKNTNLKLTENVNKFPLLHINDYCNSGVKGLYTVKGAKAIKEARKYKIPYYWKETGKAKEVEAEKKSGTYYAGWEKIKTTIHKYDYKFSKKKIKWKWRETKSPTKTIYKVYGKKKKGGSYQFITTTKKRSIMSKYKYIKAVPVKEWD